MIRTYKHHSGKDVPIVVKQVVSHIRFHKLETFKVGDLVRVHQPYGGYGITPAYKDGVVTYVGMIENNRHMFKDDVLEIYKLDKLC